MRRREFVAGLDKTTLENQPLSLNGWNLNGDPKLMRKHNASALGGSHDGSN
jgi:hypothetical protein